MRVKGRRGLRLRAFTDELQTAHPQELEAPYLTFHQRQEVYRSFRVSPRILLSSFSLQHRLVEGIRTYDLQALEGDSCTAPVRDYLSSHAC